MHVGCLFPTLTGEKVEGGTKFVVPERKFFQPLAPSGVKKGTEAAHPGFSEFDTTTKLEGESSKEAVLGAMSGKLKMLGYEGQELIQVKSP